MILRGGGGLPGLHCDSAFYFSELRWLVHSMDRAGGFGIWIRI